MVRFESPKSTHHTRNPLCLRASVAAFQSMERIYSTVTDLAKLRGWSTLAPRLTAM